MTFTTITENHKGRRDVNRTEACPRPSASDVVALEHLGNGRVELLAPADLHHDDPIAEIHRLCIEGVTSAP